MNEIYGELNTKKEFIEYQGGTTETAEVRVIDKTIYADVKLDELLERIATLEAKVANLEA